MRIVYVLLTYLLAPLVIVMEAWKALWNPEYRGRLGQRLGFVPPEPSGESLWVHAVSVGEVQAAAALIQALRQLFPTLAVVITTVTPTGAQRARTLFGDAVRHCYLPYDLPGAKKVGCYPGGVPCAVVYYEDLARPGYHVDVDRAEDEPLGCGDKNVARPGNLVDSGDRFCAQGQRRYRLRPSNPEYPVYASKTSAPRPTHGG